MNKTSPLFENGFLILDYPLPKDITTWVIAKKYLELDQYFLKECLPGSSFYNFLRAQFAFEHLEHIIAVRSSPHDDEGIWHDDGSRQVGFSLSLNLNPNLIKGGHLYLKKRIEDAPLYDFPPQPFGKLILFLTGQFNYEHRVSKVTEGERIVIAGWGI